ncbi:MAG: Rieske (2Fe-2S) protein [Halobacteria archaeon]
MGSRVADTSELGSRDRYVVEGTPLVVYRVEEEFKVYVDVCPHAGARLSNGGFHRGVIRCPRHGAEFDPETGENKSFPVTDDLRSVESFITNGVLYVDFG